MFSYVPCVGTVALNLFKPLRLLYVVCFYVSSAFVVCCQNLFLSLSRSLCINVCVVYIGIGILVLAFFEFPDSFVASDER